MSKRFIVGLESGDKNQDREFIAYLKRNKVSWWHWINNFWLIVDKKGDLTAKDVRKALNKTHPKTRNLIIEIGEEYDTWVGYGPASEKRNMFNWLKEAWNKFK